MNNRNKQTQAMAEEFRLVMQKKRMKGFAKMIGEKKKKNCYCDKMNANRKKTVNEFEWMDLIAKKKQTATWQKNVWIKKSQVCTWENCRDYDIK